MNVYQYAELGRQVQHIVEAIFFASMFFLTLGALLKAYGARRR